MPPVNESPPNTPETGSVQHEHPHTRLLVGAIFVAVVLGAASMYLWWSDGERDALTRTEPLKVGILQNVKHLDPIVDGFKRGLEELGYEEGVDVVYEYQNVDGDIAKAEQVIRSFIADGVDLMYILTPPPVELAIRLTGEMEDPTPIVFTNGYGLVQDGFLESYKSSGINVTGVIPDDIDVSVKKLEFFKAIQPDAERVGVFYSSVPGQSLTNDAVQALHDAAPQFGLEIVEYDIATLPTPASTVEMQRIADAIQPGDIDAIVTVPDLVSNFRDNPTILIELSKRIKAPVLFLTVPRVYEGGLLSYSQDYIVFGAQAAAQADKIFRGMHPSEIPIEFSVKNHLIINMQTAKELGLTIPESLRFNADEVIPAEEE